MRELKFRMYALDIQKMFEMDRLNLPCTTHPNPASIYMQYTGVRDDENKEIYEGDIVMVSHMLVENIPTYMAIGEWDKYRFALRNLDAYKPRFENYGNGTFGLAPFMTTYTNLDPFGLSLKIIGNIYENPELIEGETKQ